MSRALAWRAVRTREGVDPLDMPTKTVLFIDDDERLLESLRLVLHREPFRILTATSLDRARRLLGDHTVGVIVADDRLGTGSGVGFLATLRQLHHPAVRIVLSGAGIHTAQRAINDAGVFRFLAKPCPTKLLVQALDEAFEMSPISRIQPILARDRARRRPPPLPT